MRLLIVTQTVDRTDPTLGFFHQWIEEFARHSQRVIVVCLFEGEHSLPGNVTVLSLGKERTREKALSFFSLAFSRLRYLYRFFLYIWKYRRGYDAVFVHMNQIYVLLGGPLWRLLRKRVSLWYAHGAVSSSLRTAERLADAIITSTPEGFRLSSEKVRVLGQGIDTERFARRARSDKQSAQRSYRPDLIRILYVGRISPVKRCETLIEAAGILREKGEKFSITFVGDAGADPAYYTSLEERIRALDVGDRVRFAGGVSHDRVPQYLCRSDVFANPSETGSLDKAGLEAMAAGVPLITCNEAFAGVLGTYAERLMFPKGDPSALADRIIAVHHASDRERLIDTLAEVVRQEHSLETLIPRILSVINDISV